MKESGTAEQAVEWVMMAQGKRTREDKHTLTPKLYTGQLALRGWKLGNGIKG